jgi:glycosyltransferase involved in cell wall biosynthesis
MLFVCMGEGELADHLRRRGARVEIFDGLRELTMVGHRSMATAAVRIASTRGDARRLHPVLRANGVRVVHTHWLPQQLIAGHLRRQFGYTSVWQINNNSTRQRLGGLALKLNHRMARWGADLLLPASDYIADNWRGSGVPMRTVRNAAEAVFDGPPPALPPGGPVRCVIAGRLEASKGHHLAVAAVLAARAAGLDVTLDVFGGPLDEVNDYARQLTDTARAAGHADAVRLLGFRTDLRQRHRDYHLGLQCRVDPEPCSLWVCETLVDGLPLLASANGGTPELVADGETGLLFRSGDGRDLADKLIALARDPARLADMRQAAYQRGQREFTLARFIRQTFDAYDERLYGGDAAAAAPKPGPTPGRTDGYRA